MMNRKRTKRIGKTKYLMFLPLAALLMIISNIEMVARTAQEFTKDMAGQEAPQPAGQFEETSPLLSPTELPSATNPQNGEKAITKDTVNPEEDIFMLVEEMPVFPGGKGAFLQYLNENIRYPEDARQQKIEGQEIVKFIVKKDGSIANPEIVRSLSPSLDTEAIRLITSMPKWIPGKQRGQAVNVVVHAPINFQLKKKEAPKAEEIQQSDMQGIVVVGYGSSKSTQEDPAVKTADKMPAFPGGKEALFRYLAQNIKYPTIAQENKEQGVVNVKMIIGKDGSISKVQVVNSPSPALGIEAIRVVNKMPKWIPGEVNGKPVNVEYTFPITFRLQ